MIVEKSVVGKDNRGVEDINGQNPDRESIFTNSIAIEDVLWTHRG